jgi:hypothetical protein
MTRPTERPVKPQTLDRRHQKAQAQLPQKPLKPHQLPQARQVDAAGRPAPAQNQPDRQAPKASRHAADHPTPTSLRAST